jgi:hypothetical protein
MPSVCWRREFDVPSGGTRDILESLSELSQHNPALAADSDLEGTVVDYTAALEVLDDVETGRVLVVWTATFPVPDTRMAIAEVVGHAVFRDFVDQLRHEVIADASSAVAS